MTRAEWIEVLAIGVVAAISRLAWPYFYHTMAIWQIVLDASALLLAQSLVRDVTIMFRHRAMQNQPRKEAQCFCLESTVGATGVAAGAVLAGLMSSKQIAVVRWEFFVAVVATMTFGFLIKDFVIAWRPLRVRREKNHLNLIVRWKSKPD